MTVQEQDAIVTLGKIRGRLGDMPRVSSGYHEFGAKKEGLIREELNDPESWRDVILKGPQIGVATPFFKQPPDFGTSGRPQDITVLAESALPRSEYIRATDYETYLAAQDRWVDYRESDLRPYSEFYRVMWREMIPQANERSLFAALYPPGPTHIHGVRSMSMPDSRDTVLVAGFMSGLIFDYLLRVTKTEHFDVKNLRSMPGTDSSHPLAASLILRTLRLNCLTSAYADLWEELYEPAWGDEHWMVEWPQIRPLSDIGRTWEYDTPLRTEYERRAALVEIDALTAVWLGITEKQLQAIYLGRFPVLSDFEDVTWFDANGRKIAGNWNTFGTGQTKQHWEQFESYLESPSTAPPPEGYTPPFYKANRITEYRQAHAVFTERMKRCNRGINSDIL